MEWGTGFCLKFYYITFILLLYIAPVGCWALKRVSIVLFAVNYVLTLNVSIGKKCDKKVKLRGILIEII